MTQYAGNASNYPTDFPLVDDTTSPKAADYNPGLEALGDRTANMNSRLQPLERHDGSHRIVKIQSATVDDGTYAELKRWDASMPSFASANIYGITTLTGLLTGDIVDLVATTFMLAVPGDASAHTLEACLTTAEGGGAAVQQPGCLKRFTAQGGVLGLWELNWSWAMRHVMSVDGNLAIGINGHTDGAVGTYMTFNKPYSFVARVLRQNT